MRIHRGYLFWGVFFVVLGAIPLADRLGLIDVGDLGQLGRFWPLAVIAVGIAVLVSRTRVSLLGPLTAGLVLGSLAGVALASGAGFVFDAGGCGDLGAEPQRTTQSGTASAGLSVELRLTCGAVDVETVDGATWSVEAVHREEAPTIEADTSTLRVAAPDGLLRRQEWQVSLPAQALDELEIDVNATRSTVDVTGADLTSVDVEANAGNVTVVATDSTIESLDVAVNAGAVRLLLDGDVDGSVAANAGSIELCTSAAAELTLEVKEQLTFDADLDGTGLVRSGDSWHRAGSGGPSIVLRVEGNAASFRLDPPGGCR
jgi:hypothetical protein